MTCWCVVVRVCPEQIGSKGLEIKVDNPESYNFRPREMLREICTTISQFSTQPGFHKVRGFDPLHRSAGSVSTLGMTSFSSRQDGNSFRTAVNWPRTSVKRLQTAAVTKGWTDATTFSVSWRAEHGLPLERFGRRPAALNVPKPARVVSVSLFLRVRRQGPVPLDGSTASSLLELRSCGRKTVDCSWLT